MPRLCRRLSVFEFEFEDKIKFELSDGKVNWPYG